MGAKTSKSELTRKKSFSNLGRSSQRSLFQKSKLKLSRICKQIEKTDVEADLVTLERIRNDIDETEKELNEILDTVKTKNQEKYDEVCKCLQSTRDKFEGRFPLHSSKELEEIELLDDTNEIILRNETNHADNSPPEPRKHSVTFREMREEVYSFDEQKKPSIKFGVQVLPPTAQMAQVVLKRKTYPVNTSPKSELASRNTTDGGFPQTQNGTLSKIVIQSNSFSSETVSQSAEYSSELIEGSSRRRYMKSNSIVGIEAINGDVNELESKLRYFTGNKDSQNYIELHEGLTNNLAKLDNIDTDDDPITKQEKRILNQRINELLRILECLVEQIGSESDEQLSESKPSAHFEERSRILTSISAV